MSFLIRFFSRNGVLLFFLFLQIISVTLIFSKNSMQQSYLAAQTTAFNAWVSGYIDQGASYLKLKQVNEDLTAQNKMLMEQLYGREKSKNPAYKRVMDNTGGGQIYNIVDAEIVNNSITRNDNYFTINRGKRHGVFPKMGVIAPNGIAGIIINTTDNYALAQSVLSVNKIKLNAALKNNGYFGTLTWKGENSRTMHLSDIPKYVTLKVGDTVVTDGKSSIFPEGIMIGRVAGYEVDSKTGFWDISVELSQKMGQLQKVFVVRNLKKLQVKQIQDTLDAAIKND